MWGRARLRGLFQTTLIHIRADPSYPCRSVFYSAAMLKPSAMRGKARLRGLFQTTLIHIRADP
ncbi:MAG: hypothetical protein J7455_14655, partial [Roseiflexus sp.]|nr:hypothetical protein [Roseiflexus sp.]